MHVTEQGIGTERLEKLRRAADKGHKIKKRAAWIALALVIVWRIWANRYLFMESGLELSSGAVVGLLFSELLTIAIAMILIHLVLYIALFNGRYNRFNAAFKSHFVQETLSRSPALTGAGYEGEGAAFTYEELGEAGLLPMGVKTFFRCADKLTGAVEGTNFRSGMVVTAVRSGSKGSPREVFNGQVVAFALPEAKLGLRLQIFQQKMEKMMKRQTVGEQVWTGDAAFDDVFFVYTDNKDGALALLATPVLQKILALSEKAADRKLYLSFDGRSLYIGCDIFKNPFDAVTYMPVEEQRANILADVEILQMGRDILEALR